MGTFAHREWNPALGPRVNSRYYSTRSEPDRERNRLRKRLLHRPGSDLTDENERANPATPVWNCFRKAAAYRDGVASGNKSGWPHNERNLFAANEFTHRTGD